MIEKAGGDQACHLSSKLPQCRDSHDVFLLQPLPDRCGQLGGKLDQAVKASLSSIAIKIRSTTPAEMQVLTAVSSVSNVSTTLPDGHIFKAIRQSCHPA